MIEKKKRSVSKEHAAAYMKKWRKKNKAQQKKYKIAHHKTIKGFLSRRSRFCRKRGGGDITAAQLHGIWVQQDGKCVLTGRTLLIACGVDNPDSLSVDRINPKGLYTLENIRLITFQANSARGVWTDDQLMSFCMDVIKEKGKANNHA